MTGAPIGLILAGGGSTRLGGGDKSLLPLGPQTMLRLVVWRFGPQCARLWLGANGDAARFAALGLAVLPDHPEDVGTGPLAGVLAGLDRAAAAGATVLATVPADVPFLPNDLVRRLAAAQAMTGAAVVVAASGGRRHPLAALWAVSLRDDLRHALRQEGVRRVGAFLARHDVAEVAWPAVPHDPFFNVNTPDELATARARASAAGAADVEDEDRPVPLD